MSDTDKSVQQVLEEAERIRAGEKSGTPTGSPTPAEVSPEGGGAGTPPPPPLSLDCTALANLCVVLGDVACTKFFGAAGQLQEPLRSEAVKAWAAVLEQYAPLLGQAGPWGSLLAVYSVHLLSCAMVTSWTPAPSSASSADAEAGRLHS